MRIAILGGGAGGLAASWLLDPAHDVTLYEREAVLGGHVRTAGGNVPCPGLPAGLRLDVGVQDFSRSRSPTLHAWLRALGVPAAARAVDPATRLFRRDGRRLAVPCALGDDHPTPLDRARAWAAQHPLARALRAFLRATERRPADELSARTVGSFLGDDAFAAWVCARLACEFFTPASRVRGLSAAIAVPTLREALVGGARSHLPDGVSAYVDRAAGSLRRGVRLGARLRGVIRHRAGVTVRDEAGHDERFDAVVLALPPHRVLPVLLDASEAERARWSPWQGEVRHTVLHRDPAPWARRGAPRSAALDLFEGESGGFGSNATLDRGAARAPRDERADYALAFGLDHELDPAKVIHRQPHDVAEYSQRSLATREVIERAQGERGTWVVGAFLGDGLHEGAVSSALRVAGRLGGRSLGAPPRVTEGSEGEGGRSRGPPGRAS